MDENEKLKFAEIANAENTASGEQVFMTMVAQYVGKISALKLVTLGQGTEEIEHAMTMGEWMLVELAMATFGVPFADGATITRRAIRAARHNIAVISAADLKNS